MIKNHQADNTAHSNVKQVQQHMTCKPARRLSTDYYDTKLSGTTKS